MSHDVYRDVPIPKARRPHTPTRRKYPLDVMAVGEMFFVPDKTKNTLATHVSTVGKSLGRKFITRLTYMVRTKQGWRPATEVTPNAVLGVGVWRKE